MGTYTGMSERVTLIVDYGDGKSDVLRMGPLRLQLHLTWLSLYSQKYTKHAKSDIQTFKWALEYHKTEICLNISLYMVDVTNKLWQQKF